MRNVIDKKVVVIGGGTGSFAVLCALKGRVADLAALVSMTDDGSSTGILRDELGVLPPGDVRNCLVALSEAPESLRNLFSYRFEEGTFKGHPLGNLFLSAAEKMTNNFGDAVRVASEVLRIDGHVIPITLDNVRLVLEWDDKTVVRGQGTIDKTDFGEYQGGRPNLYLDPPGHINPEAKKAIAQADVVIIAPGDIYTSLGPLLVVEGVSEALANVKAKIVYACNLMVKPGHTTGFTVADHAAEIERFAGGPIVDVVLYNTGTPPPELLEKYACQGERPVPADTKEFTGAHYEAVGYDLIARAPVVITKGDTHAVRRSLIRHDQEALSKAILTHIV
ncbi:MAG TPA: gluconeogenesis factor YvcK family protein [Candidatus Saccharimonadales bacterium]|nr:gluconeogenesis factor YvcK family protein [Candidatus Saccharimonadales bacterium]